MQNFASWDEVTRWTLEPAFFGGVGLIASLTAARCNCSLNNHLSGVASLPFSAGLHSVLSCSEASVTRTVAFLCLPGQLRQPLHQGWLLETFLSKRYVFTWCEADLCPVHLLREGNKRSLLATETGGFNLAKHCGEGTWQTSLQQHTDSRTPSHAQTHTAHYNLPDILKPLSPN